MPLKTSYSHTISRMSPTHLPWNLEEQLEGNSYDCGCSSAAEHMPRAIILKGKDDSWGVVVHPCHPSTWEVMAGGSGVQVHPYRELGASLGYMKVCLKRETKESIPRD